MSDEARVRRSALLVCTVGSFLVPFMGSSLVVALPDVGRDLGAGAVLLSWVNTAFLLASAALALPVGRLADLYGRKRLFAWGIAIFTLGAALCAVAPGPSLLVAARVLQGVGGAMLSGASIAILTAVFPPAERGRVIGINTAAVYLGISVGPFLGGMLTSAAGWRAVFALNVPVGLLVLWLVAFQLHGEWHGARGERFDLVGAVLYAVGMVGLMLGLTLVRSPAALALVPVGVAALLAFGWWETRQREPLFDMGLVLANRVFALSSLAALASYATSMGSSFLMSLYLQVVRGMTPREAGLVLLVQPVMQTLVTPLAGRLSDRVEPRWVASVGMVLTSLALALLAPFSADMPLWWVVGALGLLGIGFGTFSSPNMSAILGAVDRSRLGVASAAVGTMRLAGQTGSMGIVAVVLAVQLGGAPVTAAVQEPFLAAGRLCFTLFAAVCGAGVLASVVRGKVR